MYKQDRLDAFETQPVFNGLEVEYPHYGRISVLHELEGLVWAMVEKGQLEAAEAEEAIWDCVNWVEDNGNTI